jgi:hypothetical protein
VTSPSSRGEEKGAAEGGKYLGKISRSFTRLLGTFLPLTSNNLDQQEHTDTSSVRS